MLIIPIKGSGLTSGSPSGVGCVGQCSPRKVDVLLVVLLHPRFKLVPLTTCTASLFTSYVVDFSRRSNEESLDFGRAVLGLRAAADFQTFVRAAVHRGLQTCLLCVRFDHDDPP